MPDRWFRVPMVEIDVGGVTERRPKYSDRVERYSGNAISASPVGIYHYRADPTTLDEIAAEPDATELSESQAANLLSSESHVPDGVSGPNVNQHFPV